MIEKAIGNFFSGLVPDWVWDILPYWPWIVWAIIAIAAAGGLFRVYQLGGWPALSAAAAAMGVALGYYLGKSGVKPEDRIIAIPPKKVTPIKKKRPTIFDRFQ